MREISIARADETRIGELQQLWIAMHRVHAELAEAPPTRNPEDSWERRRRQYADWLQSGQAQLLIAERDRRAIGYLMLRFQDGPPTWDIGERVAEIESLSVAPDARSAGVGTELVRAARAAARQAGASRLLVAAAHANEPAIRFYTREGFEPFYLLMLDRDRT